MRPMHQMSRWTREFRLAFQQIKQKNERQVILVLAIVVGLLSGLAAVLLKSSVHLIQYFLVEYVYHRGLDYIYYVAPLVGVLLTAWIARRLLRDRLGHGVSQLLYAISKNHALVKPKRTYSQLLTSTVTVGMGGSVGLEAPIVVTSSAIASNLARWINMGYRARLLLIGCGTAGAIAGIFNSPIAGVLFAIEVILVDVTIFQFIPLLIASVVGAVVSQSLLGDEILFSFTLEDAFLKQDIPYYLLLGVFCGVVSIHFMRMSFWIEARMRGIPDSLYRTIGGGILLAVLIAILPPLYGEGYSMITALLNGAEPLFFTRTVIGEEAIHNTWTILGFLFLVMALKPIATALTISSGGNGGIFAPSLFMGALGGYIFARGMNFLFPGLALSTSNFTLAGMSAVMSGLLHAPLTAIFLIAEITGGYEMFIPLMITAAVGFLTSLYFERYSFYSKHLIERGDMIPTENRDERILSKMSLEPLIERDLLSIEASASFQDLILLVRKSRRNIFPVIDEKGTLCGVITLDDIRDIMFETNKQARVQDLMTPPPESIAVGEHMRSVMERFEHTQLWNLPVEEQGRYLGFVSKSRIFNAYRELLLTFER